MPSARFPAAFRQFRRLRFMVSDASAYASGASVRDQNKTKTKRGRNTAFPPLARRTGRQSVIPLLAGHNIIFTVGDYVFTLKENDFHFKSLVFFHGVHPLLPYEFASFLNATAALK